MGDAEAAFGLVRKGGAVASIAASPTSAGVFPSDEDVKSGLREPVTAPGTLSVAIPIISAKTRFSAWYAGVDYSYLFVKPSREDVEQLQDFIIEKKVRVHIHKRYPLDAATDALEELEKGGVVGKLLIDVK